MSQSLLSELKRRKVVRVAGFYLFMAWLVLQVAGAIEDALQLPEWFDGAVVATLSIGFPIALVVAWIFDLTRDGIKRTAPSTNGARGLSSLAVAMLIAIALLGGGGIATYWFLTTDTPLRIGKQNGTSSGFQSADTGSRFMSEIDSVAVLPFVDLSSGRDLDYFGIAIADELRNVLARVKGVRVASRPSSLNYSGDERPAAKEIAATMEVAYILDGSLQQVGDTLRVSVQLIEGAKDTQVMSRTFDLPYSVNNILVIQDEIASEVVTSLGRDLGEPAQIALRFTAASGTDSLAAYDAYVIARQKFFTRNRVDNAEDFEEITHGLEDATRIDPEFGHAWAALAMQYYTTISWGGDETELTRKARDAAERALALDTDLALAHAVLGVTATLPDGRIDRVAAIDGLSQAIDLDPLEPTLRSWRGQHWIELGFFTRGINDLDETIRLTVGNGVANFWTINAQLLLGDIEAALVRLPSRGRQNLRFRVLYALAITATGETQGVRSALLQGNEPEKLLQEIADALVAEDYDFNAGYKRAVAATGDDEQLQRSINRPYLLYVFRQYDRLPKEPPLSGRLTWWFSTHDDFRRSEIRYQYFHDLGLTDFWQERGFPPRCVPDNSAEGFTCD